MANIPAIELSEARSNSYRKPANSTSDCGPQESIEIPNRFLYISALDGLRLIAFLCVFIHHLPATSAIPGFNLLHTHGWVGVELFFVISAFLFFYLFDAEMRKTKALNIAMFFVRRFLRIYPLMVAFPIAMIVLKSAYTKDALFRVLGLIAGADNILTALFGYAGIPFSPHLWTLSFEFQIYAVIPFVFLVYWRLGFNPFVYLVAAVWLSCTILRLASFAFISSYLVPWVIPVLRPDSVLVGLLLSIVFRRFNLSHVALVASVSSVAFFALPSITESSVSAAFDSPIAALMCGSLVILGLRWSPLNSLLCLPFMRLAGSISFGLYVFHILGISVALKILSSVSHFEPLTNAADYALLALSAFAITFCISLVSYFLLERPFLRMKDKFTIVQGRKPETGNLLRLPRELSNLLGRE